MTWSVGRNWLVLAAISVEICIAMSLPIYGGSVANTYMAVALGWSRETLGLLVTVNMVGNAAFAPVAALAVNRLGVRSSILAGCFTMTLGGTALATVVTEPWQAVIAFSLVIGAAGALSGVIPCQTAVAAWFADRRTIALSILYAAQGGGGFLAVHAINAINSMGNWRNGWWLFAAAGVLGLALALLFIRDAPSNGDKAEKIPPRIAEEIGSVSAADDRLAVALRSPLIWAIYLAMLSLMAGSGFIIAHSQVYLRGMGFAPTMAASTVSIMSIAMVAGNLGFGGCAPVLGLKRTYVLAVVIFGAGLAMLANVQSEASLVAYAIVAGIGFGAGQVGAMALLSHYWAGRLFPALTATGLVVQTIGGGLVPVLAGAYFDANQTYTPVIYGLVCANAVAAFVLVLTGRERLHASTAPRSA